MLQAFTGLKSIAKLGKRNTESFIFYLHYRVTFLIVLSCSILISTELFMGTKITCFSRQPEINTDLLNAYCWAASTYSVNKAYLKEVGVHIPHPGIEGSENESEYEYRNFYQYVHIVLFIQAILFYLPHNIWKSIEPDFVHKAPEKINEFIADSTKDNTNNTPLNDVAIFIEARWGKFRLFAFQYFMCELLACVNVFLQTYLLDVFFHGKFLSLGLLFEAYYSSEILSDPLRLFPLVTVCSFRKYGASGHVDINDALCILPINAINAKIFLCLWIWFTTLFFLTLCSIVHFVVCMFIPVFRIWSLKIKSRFSTGNIENSSYQRLALEGDFGDWFVLTSLKRNTDEKNFYYLADDVLNRIDSFDEEGRMPGQTSPSVQKKMNAGQQTNHKTKQSTNL